MPVRHQIFRNIDAAWDWEKNVVAFFIVEGGDPDPFDAPAAWQEASRQTVSAEALDESLPHRSTEERSAIASAFLGVTTWQRVCSVFDIPWTSLPHVLEEEPSWGNG
jgi:hypothetical protein